MNCRSTLGIVGQSFWSLALPLPQVPCGVISYSKQKPTQFSPFRAVNFFQTEIVRCAWFKDSSVCRHAQIGSGNSSCIELGTAVALNGEQQVH
jgi:hypothetical protein